MSTVIEPKDTAKKETPLMGKKNIKHDFTDPYSRDLAYFFTQAAAGKKIEQLQLLKEWAVYEDLRPFIRAERDEEGNILEFKTLEGYEEKKKTIKHIPGR